MEPDRVLDEYRTGNADKRLNLFLYHRELRDEFTAIEQESPSDLFGLSCGMPAHQSIAQRMLGLLKVLSFRPGPGRSRADANP